MLKEGDVAAIQRAIAAYGVALDRQALELFDACFTVDAWIEMNGERLTISAYRARCARAFALFPIMQHQFGLPFLSMRNDGVVLARTPFVAYHARHRADDGLIIGGEYEDCFIRTDGTGWRISSRLGLARWHHGDMGILSGIEDDAAR